MALVDGEVIGVCTLHRLDVIKCKCRVVPVGRPSPPWNWSRDGAIGIAIDAGRFFQKRSAAMLPYYSVLSHKLTNQIILMSFILY